MGTQSVEIWIAVAVVLGGLMGGWITYGIGYRNGKKAALKELLPGFDLDREWAKHYGDTEPAKIFVGPFP
jgi:membrane protein DedA with SNARE-associated domain